MDAAIGNDFDVLVGEQHIDQDAAVVLGVPDPKATECLEGARTGAFVLQHQRQRQRGFDRKTDLTHMATFALGDRPLYPIEHGGREGAPAPYDDR